MLLLLGQYYFHIESITGQAYFLLLCYMFRVRHYYVEWLLQASRLKTHSGESRLTPLLLFELTVCPKLSKVLNDGQIFLLFIAI